MATKLTKYQWSFDRWLGGSDDEVNPVLTGIVWAKNFTEAKRLASEATGTTYWKERWRLDASTSSVKRYIRYKRDGRRNPWPYIEIEEV